MTKGCKIWLWFLLIGGGISVIVGIISMGNSAILGIGGVIGGIIQMVSIALLLFKERKEGFYLLCGISAISLIGNIIYQVGVGISIIGCVGRIGITYYFLNKGKNAQTVVPSAPSSTGSTENKSTYVSESMDPGTSGETSSTGQAAAPGGSSQNMAGNTNAASGNAKRKTDNAQRANTAFDGKTPIFGAGKNIDVSVDLYKELDIDRSWDEKAIRNHLKGLQKTWIQRQGATNDKEQLLIIDKLLENVQEAVRYLTKAAKRQQYDQALDLAYKAGKITDAREEKLYTILDQAKAYYRKGNIKLATKFAEEAVEGEVNDVSAYDLLARCYYDSDAYEKALGVIDHGISIFKTDINLRWLGARIATIGTKNFDEAQQRVNDLIALAPENSVGHSEQVYLHLRKGDEPLAFQEIDSYIAAHPDDNVFKRSVAYDLDAYSNSCYYYDAAQNATFIADGKSYNKCLALRKKAVEVFNDEHTQNQLEKAQYYGRKEWNDWNLPAIKSLALYGTIFAVLGYASEAFLALGLVLYMIMALLIYFSFRPYWQINKTYVTGQMGTLEMIVSQVGEKSAWAAQLALQWLIRIVGLVLKFVLGLASGRWF